MNVSNRIHKKSIYIRRSIYMHMERWRYTPIRKVFPLKNENGKTGDTLHKTTRSFMGYFITMAHNQYIIRSSWAPILIWYIHHCYWNIPIIVELIVTNNYDNSGATEFSSSIWEKHIKGQAKYEYIFSLSHSSYKYYKATNRPLRMYICC
jgi:hypothetical protein